MKPYICTYSGLFEITKTDEEDIFSESYTTSIESLSIKDDEKSHDDFNNCGQVNVKEIFKHGNPSTVK